jgi:1-acyl-sn-glycerol-3-phosphate acyltransferase
VNPRPARFYPLTILMFSIGYLSYFLSKTIFLVCAVPLVVVLAPFPQTKYRLFQAVTRGYLEAFTRTWLPILGVYRIIEISGLERAVSGRPAICVANHRGFMDALLLLGLLPRTAVLIKARDTRQPTYALLERHFDLLSVDRHSRDSIAASLERGRQILAQGKNLLVFPEGTRARSGRLQNFNRFAFELARATGAPVRPVIIHSTQPFMAKLPGSIFPRARNEYRMRFLDPEPLRPDDAPSDLSDRVHRRMAQELRALDAGTVWEVRSMRDE